MNIEDELRGISGTGDRPEWSQIESRAAKLRRRRHRIRGGVALGAIMLGIGLLVSFDGGTSTTRTEDSAADSSGYSVDEPPTTIDVSARTCESVQPAELSVDPAGEIAALLAEIAVTGVAEIPFPPDCTVRAFVDAAALVVVDGEPHADLAVYGIDGDQIGVLVYGLPAMTIQEYESDPQGHRRAGLARVEDLKSAAAGTAPDE